MTGQSKGPHNLNAGTPTGVGQDMHALAQKLFPICRSMTGNGVRETLAILKQHLPELVVHEIPSGTQVFDWDIPPEWNVQDAYVVGPSGEKVIDFKDNNLRLVGYSEPVDTVMDLEDLQSHLYSLPHMPDAIPYVTSYYKRRWGFCLKHAEREALPPGEYRVRIDSSFNAAGSLTYGELYIPGQTNQEIFLSTYICHPSMANNELSGPVVTTYLAKWIAGNLDRRFSYRIVFIPETIGSIAYISRHLHTLKANVIAGFVVTCVGDDRTYSFMPSRCDHTLSDRAAVHVLSHIDPEFKTYSFLERGSDERQYCSPGVDLPMATIMRSKYDEYPEYHTSLDDLTLVTPNGLAGGYNALVQAICAIEAERKYQATNLCEPQLGKRGLYSTLSQHNSYTDAAKMRLDLLAYCDGAHSTLDLADLLGVPVWDIVPYLNELTEHGLIQAVEA